MTFKMKLNTPIALAATMAGLAAISACGSETATKTDSAPDTTASTTSGSGTGGDGSASAQAHATKTPGEVLDYVLAGDHRSDEERARDQFRHPKETLLFFGVKPNQRVAEMFPGGGWYTKVLAPYLAKGDGQYIAVQFNPGDNERRVEGLNRYKDNFSDKTLYGDVAVELIDREGSTMPADSYDTVLTFRNVHNWMGGEIADDFFQEFYRVLKPGGVLGVVEHRGDPAVEQDPRARTGYVREDFTIEMALAAGFELEASSEINANPNDTRDHPFGVWTLPPVKRSSATRGEVDEGFDRAKYDAIGESDRMTLKFRKPVEDKGALLE